MRQEENSRVRILIQQSKILSSLEKAEWIQLLGNMSDDQVFELGKILDPKNASQNEPFKAVTQVRATLKPGFSVDIKQKEIATTVPFYIQEIPANLPHSLKPISAPVPLRPLQTSETPIIQRTKT